MSFINHLIKRAKEAERPCTLDVPYSKVGAIVEHILGCEGQAYGNREQVHHHLLHGHGFALLGCRLRVVGKPTDTSPTPAIFPRGQASRKPSSALHSESSPLSRSSTEDSKA